MWVSAVVFGPQTPGWMILELPEKPGMWCGTMAPRPMTTSASTTARFTWSGVPAAECPRSTSMAGSRHSWLKTRMRRHASGPALAASSSAVMYRCVPKAMMQAMLRSGTPAAFSRSRSGGTMRSAGVNRVLSSLTIRTRSPGFTHSASGGWPIGWSKASAMAASRSPSGAERFGEITWERFSSGTSKLRGRPAKGMVTVVISSPLRRTALPAVNRLQRFENGSPEHLERDAGNASSNGYGIRSQ